MRRRNWGILGSVIILFIFAGLLGSCERKPLTDKAQVRASANTVISTIKDQGTELTAITNSLEKSQSLYLKEHKEKPNENLLKNKQSSVYANVSKRTEALTTLTTDYKTLNSASDTLAGFAKSKTPNLPTEQIQDLVQSLKIISLDHDTFSQFMDEFTKAEQTFYADTADTTDEKAMDTAVGRFNQYYGALFQQMEIMQANLTTAQQQSKELLKALK